ncbi:hypothetical protein ACLKMH_10955 [Psychromonas sp. KJ10-10]|uniref:hypothetical protein n=1 Tax=Psychromonas sp. KJ10-10 TaxID=3391823 RepID=UPI0039B39C35
MGWFLEYFFDDNEYWLCCGNIVETTNGWKCFLKCHSKGLFSKKVAPAHLATPMLEALKIILNEENEIADVVWETVQHT